jgi:Heavy-metal resistance
VPNRSQTWAAALLVAVFAAGVATGWGLRGSTTRHAFNPRDTKAMVAHLAKELDLSAAQQDSVRVIIDRHRAEMEAIWKQVHPRVDSLRTVLQTEISAQLTPAQQSRYRDLVARFEHQRRGADTGSKEHR